MWIKYMVNNVCILVMNILANQLGYPTQPAFVLHSSNFK
uniref:Uncharacterized protein n=1 Tax=Arundo donax TaxID=35708 RepID=A0A0A9AUL1_ARUDO